MITIQVPDRFALTPGQVAEALQIDIDTVYKYGKYPTTNPNHIVSFKVGPRDLRIEASELVNYIKRNYTNPDIQYLS